MTESPVPEPAPPAAPPPPPAPAAPKRLTPKSPDITRTYTRFLVGFLILCCGVLIVLGMRHRAEAGRLAAREKRMTLLLSRVEHLRSLLQRADRVARFAGLSAHDIEEIHGFADQVIERVGDAFAKQNAADLEVFHRLRGHAYELKYDFENARLDYEESIKLVPGERSPAFFDRGFLQARLFFRATLLDAPKESLDALTKEAEDLRRGVATSDDLLLRGMAHAAYAICIGDDEGAQTIANGALTQDEHDWWLRLVRGIARLRGGKTKDAIEDFNDALRNYPYGAEINAWRARCLLAMGEKVRAMDALGGSLLCDGQFYEAYVLRARLLFEDGQFDAARQHFENAAKLRADAAEPRLGIARAAYEAWIRSEKKDVTPLNSAAEAITFFLGQHPKDADGYVLRARINLARGAEGRESAERDAEEAVKLLPTSSDAWLLLASTRTEPAIAAADYAVAAKFAADRPARARVLQERARALVRARSNDKALAEYDDLVKELPDDVSIGLERARLLLAMAKLREAVDAILPLAKLYPTNPHVFTFQAEALLANGDAAGALASATTSWGLDPTSGAPLVVRGRAHAKLGDKENARLDWIRAKDLLPARTAEIEALLKTIE